MRVFIGIELSPSVKTSLMDWQLQLKPYSIKGNFTTPTNYHLTLQFIGEATMEEIDVFKSIVSSIAKSSRSFELALIHVGEFPKKNKSILWAGPDSRRSLNDLYDKVHQAFSLHHVAVEKRPFTPHVTLGRNIVLTDAFETIKKEQSWNTIPIIVDNVTLFESTRINDQLVYRAIAKHEMTC